MEWWKHINQTFAIHKSTNDLKVKWDENQVSYSLQVLDKSLFQVWSAWRICWACESGPRYCEIRLQPILHQYLCTCVGSDFPWPNVKTSTARRPLIPTLSSGETSDTWVVLFYCKQANAAWWLGYEFTMTLVCTLQESQHIRTTVGQNMKKVFEVVNSLPGFCCQPLEGGIFAFPRLHLPPKATERAKVLT